MLTEMDVNLEEIRNRTLTVKAYLNGIEQRFLEKFLSRKETYTLEENAKREIKQHTKNQMILAFSAHWCKDCATSIPVLYLLAETTGIEVRVFGGIKSDPLSHSRKWRIPPSPKEMETFKIEKIPTIIVFDEQGHEMGRLVENPRIMPTLEQEIWEIMRLK
jgi:thiol-disulfide isomerase/thioredoxin